MYPQTDQWGRPLQQTDPWGRPVQSNVQQTDQWGHPVQPPVLSNERIPQPEYQQRVAGPQYPATHRMTNVSPFVRETPPSYVNNQPPMGFGRPEPLVGQDDNTRGPIRTRRKRGSTASTPQYNTTQPPTRRVVVEDVLLEDINVILEPGINIIKDVNENYIYTGESKMKELNVAETENDNITIPVPDRNILGDTIYAGMVAALHEQSATIAHQGIVAEYNYFTANTQELMLGKEFVSIDDFIMSMRHDIKNGSPAAAVVNTRLTNLFNLLLKESLGSRIKIDSLVDDYFDMADIVKGFNPDTKLGYAKIVSVINNIASTVVVTTTEGDPSLECLRVKETYVVLDIDSLDQSAITAINDAPKHITPNSAPVIYNGIKTITCVENEPHGFVYLLTDGFKYTLASVDDTDAVIIKRV